MVRIYYSALILFIIGLSSCNRSKTYHIYFDDTVPQLKFAVDDLINELSKKGMAVERGSVESFTGKSTETSIVVAYKGDDTDQLCKLLDANIPEQKKSQSYSIRVNGEDKTNAIAVMANDANGAMYGLMDITEAIKLQTINELKDYDKEPYVEKRGIKFIGIGV